MLNGRYLPDKVRRYYQEMPIFPSLVQVSLGCFLSGKMRSEPL
jgi:hypothetical protein